MRHGVAARRRRLPGVLLIGLLLAAELATAGALDPALGQQTKASIDVGLKHLRFQQLDDGSWNGDVRATALVMWALAESHRRYTAEDGPFMRRGLEFVASGIDPARATLGESALALAVLGSSLEPGHRVVADAAQEAVIDALMGEEIDHIDCRDLSLALGALRSAGVGEDHATWREASRVAAGCRDGEGRDGGTGAAALPWLGATGAEDESDLAGAAAEILALGADEPLPKHHYYFLVDALSRVARSGGGGGELRPRLAERLTASQQFEGSWPAVAGDPYEDDATEATAFALLALERLYDDRSWP